MKKLLIINIVILLVILLAGWFFTLGARAVSPPAKVYIDPSLVGAKAVNDTFTVYIRIADVADLYGWQLDVSFDSTILQAQSVTEGEFLKRGDYSGNTSFSSGDTSTPGLIKGIYCLRLEPSTSHTPTGETGSGILATITFKVIGTGTSNIGLTNILLSDSNVDSIEFISYNGAFDNTPPTAPSIISPVNGTLLNTTNIPVSGTAEASSTVKVYEGAILKATTTADAAGSWNTTVSLTEGTHSLTAIATDAAGNTSESSTTVNVTVDITPPPAPTVNPVTSPTNLSLQTITGGKSTDSVSVWVNGAAATITSSTTWSYTISLVEGTNSISVTAQDEAGNVSLAVNTSIILDTQPPIAISDLGRSGRTATSITLSWTAPGDDGGSGTATEYDLRYSTSPILTDSDWAAAVQITDEPIPAVAGTIQSYIVNGLNPETAYYFAIKTKDETSNWSTISNILSAYTLNVADITGDGTVNIFDLVKAGKAFGSVPGDTNWDPEADLKKDSVINIFDLVIVGKNFGKTVP